MRVKIYAILLREDDPLKNTAIKMIRAGLVEETRKRLLKSKILVLNPYSKDYLGPWYRDIAVNYGILVVDASWHRLTPLVFRDLKGIHVKLPPLLPGNPINYGKPCILSSIEAVAASLHILGFTSEYWAFLGLYKWMKTFHELNKELLKAYSSVNSLSELLQVIREYWGTDDPCYQITG